MANKLKLDSFNVESGPVSILDSPAVLDAFDVDKTFLGSRPVVELRVVGLSIRCTFSSRVVTYPLQSIEDVKVNKEKGTISFTSRDQSFVVRGFKDSDRKWFLKGTGKKTASAEQMENMFVRSLSGGNLE